jgi:hypothetical protein
MSIAHAIFRKEMLSERSAAAPPEPGTPAPVPHVGLSSSMVGAAPARGGDPVRHSGDLFRAMGWLLVGSRPDMSREALAHELQHRLATRGVRYHVRTLKRQLSGAVRTVWPAAESAMAEIVAAQLGLRSLREVRDALAAAGLGPFESRPVQVAVQEVVGLTSLWLYLNPQRSRRFLAARLQARLREAGVAFALDSLQAILAGTKSGTQRAVYDKLVELLGESVGSEGEVLALARMRSADIVLAARGRELVPAARLHGLCQLWRAQHREPSFRRLCLHLQQRLAERGLRLSLPRLQAIASGRVRAVRRRVAHVLEQSLRGELDARADRLRVGRPASLSDFKWIDSRVVRELAEEWLARHPGATRRQLALRLAQAVRAMGHSMSHNSIQPLLGGWTKRARGFVHRAMLAELAREARLAPAKCRIRSCVFPAARDGLCRQCWLAASDTTPFARRSSGALLA